MTLELLEKHCRGWLDEYGAAGDVDDYAGDPGGLVAGEERRDGRDILWRAEPFKGMCVGERYLQLGRYLVLVALGENCFRGNAVDADPPSRQRWRGGSAPPWIGLAGRRPE